MKKSEKENETNTSSSTSKKNLVVKILHCIKVSK